VPGKNFADSVKTQEHTQRGTQTAKKHEPFKWKIRLHKVGTKEGKMWRRPQIPTRADGKTSRVEF